MFEVLPLLFKWGVGWGGGQGTRRVLPCLYIYAHVGKQRAEGASGWTGGWTTGEER